MEGRPFCELSLFSTWIFVFFCPSACLGLEAPRIDLKKAVFVAFAGEDLRIQCSLSIPANQTSGSFNCSDPVLKQIYKRSIPETGNDPKLLTIELELKRLEHSGEYVCQYKTAKVFWFLHIRDDGYQDRNILDYSQFITVAVFSMALLVFSIVGSAFVLREYWKEHSKERNKKKEKQPKEENNETQTSQDNVDVITSPSMSFYASLDPRPRSIYDALDCSATNPVPDQSRAKPKNVVPPNKVGQTVQTQQDESVYENF